MSSYFCLFLTWFVFISQQFQTCLYVQPIPRPHFALVPCSIFSENANKSWMSMTWTCKLITICTFSDRWSQNETCWPYCRCYHIERLFKNYKQFSYITFAMQHDFLYANFECSVSCTVYKEFSDMCYFVASIFACTQTSQILLKDLYKRRD